ncbi:MAG: phosphoribosylaminoimidazolesuccinocarboxamide synthase [bacterium]|nr:phosphoribosylaminoimidazolesuccinocarboxamide synthase [bacterium]
MTSLVVDKVKIPGFEWHSGKVRDSAVVEKNIGLMVFVTTDRISAFDMVLPTIIPLKGVMLNKVSSFWKKYLSGIIADDIIGETANQYLPYLGLTGQSEWAEGLNGRTILTRKAKVVPVECVVRGYISGSLWVGYEHLRGNRSLGISVPILGHELPGDLKESSRLLQPIFTPSTKAESGRHDENLSYEQMINHLELWLLEQPQIKRWTNPKLLAQALKSTSILLYAQAYAYAKKKGVIIADTKFEFGFVGDELVLIDEVLTPDSSRFWDLGSYAPGKPQTSFDKQPVRDYLSGTGWDKKPPAPELPKDVVRDTIRRYQEIAKRFTNKDSLS